MKFKIRILLAVIFSLGFLVFSKRAEAAIPAYRASGTFTANTTAIAPPYPASMAAGDVCLLAVTSENQAISLTTAYGFAEVPTWSPQSAGTGGTNPASRLAVYWKRTTGGDSAPQVADSGDNTEGQIHCFSGVAVSGNPWDTGAGGNDSAANDTTGVIPGATTSVNDTLVVLFSSSSYNATNAAQFASWTNGNLANITERADNTNTAGLGGGHGMATGELASAGTYANTTVTLAQTSYKGAMSLALKPDNTIVNTSGTQKSGMTISSTDNYLSGKFMISSDDSRNVTGITIAEQGTIDGQANLDNIKLYYESDTSAPYDCAGEYYAGGGSEPQFGSTDTDGFSAANGTSAFTGSVAVSTTSTMCVYVVLDVGSGASNGNTIEIQISTPSSDVTASSGTVGPASAVAIAGTTTIMTAQVIGTLGKTADGWSGAVPVYMELVGISQGSYPYARAQVTTIASQTFYADMAWNSANYRYEGTIYVGSNICMGCDDPKTYNGSFSVTVQLDNNAGFPSVDYSDSAGTFTTFIVLKRSSMDAANPNTNYTDFNAVWSTDHWNISLLDLGIGLTNPVTSGTNVAVALPIHPVTSSPSNFAVTFNGSSAPQGSAQSTTNAWWYDSDFHTLYLQFASLTTTLVNVDITFDSDTDLFATRYNWTWTADMGSRRFSNGLYVANHYLTTFYYGKPFSTADNNLACGGNECEGTGMQAESRAHEDGGVDESTDCMERIAVHVDGTPRSDATTYYQYDVKWKQTETASWITEEDNDHFTMVTNSDDTASTGWAQQLNNGIAAERTQTFYTGERYIKNVYLFTNSSASSHSYPMVWEREQWHALDRATNDSGRFYGDTSDRVVEERIALSSFSCPWQTAYDTGTFINGGMIFDKNNLPDYGVFAVEPFLAPTTAEWPIVITEDHATNTADQTGFEKTFASVGAGNTAVFTFWHVHNAESSWANIDAAMDADCAEINPVVISILIGDGDISYGQVTASADTTASGVNDTQTVTNNGNVAETFEILGQDSADWTLGASAGDAIYKQAWCITNCDSSPTWTAITTAYTTLVTNIAASSYQDVDFQVTVPTSNAGSNQQDVDMTIRAVQY